MTLFDLAILLVILASATLGVWRGFLSEMIALVAWALAFVGAQHLSPFFATFFLRGIKDSGMQALVAWAAVFLLVLLVMGLSRSLLGGLIHALGMGRLDRVLGASFGTLRGIFFAILLVGAGGMTSLPKTSGWQQSALAPPLETAVLILRPWLPPDVARRIRFK